MMGLHCVPLSHFCRCIGLYIVDIIGVQSPRLQSFADDDLGAVKLRHVNHWLMVDIDD